MSNLIIYEKNSFKDVLEELLRIEEIYQRDYGATLVPYELNCRYMKFKKTGTSYSLDYWILDYTSNKDYSNISPLVSREEVKEGLEDYLGEEIGLKALEKIESGIEKEDYYKHTFILQRFINEYLPGV